MMLLPGKSTLTFAALLLATTLAACVSSQRFAAPARQPQAVPQVVSPQTSSGPYTREREDREFGQPAHDDRQNSRQR
jgi:hypothetical protein